MPVSQPPNSPGFTPRVNESGPFPPGGTSTPLPSPLTRLIARDQEVPAIGKLLRDPEVRLLTLTGPGGVGKTRLAIAAATDVSRDFTDGVVFTDLSPVSNPDLVPHTIARNVGLRDTGAGSLHDRLLVAIARRKLLLVLDNFEQVVVAAPSLRPILDGCPNVRFLITSRIRLRISGEHEFPVAPLPLDAPTSGEESVTSGAVQLFVERAQSVWPDFGPTDETMPVIAEIVRRVDGLPLPRCIESPGHSLPGETPRLLLR